MKSHADTVNAIIKKHGLDKHWFDRLMFIRRTRPTIYTSLKHVSSSGMSRRISVYMVEDGRIQWMDYLAEKLTGYKESKNGGLSVGGCGMDMGFHLVYGFSSAMFPDGFRRRKGEWHRNGDPATVDKDGGYALKQEWL